MSSNITLIVQGTFFLLSVEACLVHTNCKPAEDIREEDRQADIQLPLVKKQV